MAGAALALGACQMLRGVLPVGFGKSAILVIAVGAITWFLSAGPGIAAAGFGIASYLVVRPFGIISLEALLAIGIRMGTLLAVVLVVSLINRWLRTAHVAAERREAEAARWAAQVTLTDQDHTQQLTDLTLELRTLTGVIQLAAEAVRDEGDARTLATLNNVAQHLSRLATRFSQLS